MPGRSDRCVRLVTDVSRWVVENRCHADARGGGLPSASPALTRPAPAAHPDPGRAAVCDVDAPVAAAAAAGYRRAAGCGR